MKKILVILMFASICASAQIVPFATTQSVSYPTIVSASIYTVAGTCIMTVTGGFSVTGSCLNSSLSANYIIASTCAGTIAGSNYTVSGVCIGTVNGIATRSVPSVSVYRYNGVVSNTIQLATTLGINAVAADYVNQGVSILVSAYDLATSTVPTVTIYDISGKKKKDIFSGTQTAVGGGSSVDGLSFVDQGNLYVRFSNGSIIMYSPSGQKIKKIK